MLLASWVKGQSDLDLVVGVLNLNIVDFGVPVESGLQCSVEFAGDILDIWADILPFSFNLKLVDTGCSPEGPVLVDG